MSVCHQGFRRQPPYLLGRTLPRLPLAPPPSPLDNPSSISRSQPGSHDHLEDCYSQMCDIDPLILRVRELRHQGDFPLARCLEQELLPLF